MRRSRLARGAFALAAWVALLLLTGACASVPRAPSRDWGPAIAQARAQAAELREREGIPGLSVAVLVGDTVVWAEAFGFADLEAGRAVATATRFRLASVSKLVTAAVAARLIERDKLDPDAPITRYVADLPEALRPITVRQLAAHLGGIRHYGAKDFTPTSIDLQHFDSVRASLKIFAHDLLVAPPGRGHSYSTFGFTLLAAALEGAAETDFLTLVEQQVARPLGLESLVADRGEVAIPERSHFYDKGADGKPGPARAMDPSYKWAGGGLLANASDLARFGAAHFEPGFFAAATHQLFFTPVATTSGEPTGYGFGWRLGRDEALGLDFAHHAGNQAGSRAFLGIYREARVAVALLSNLGGVPADIEGASRALARPFLETLGVGATAAAPKGP